MQEQKEWVNSVAFSPDGSLLISSSGEKTIKFWSVETGACLHTLPCSGRIVFSPNGALLATAGPDKTIQLWTAAKMTEVLVEE